MRIFEKDFGDIGNYIDENLVICAPLETTLFPIYNEKINCYLHLCFPEIPKNKILGIILIHLHGTEILSFSIELPNDKSKDITYGCHLSLNEHNEMMQISYRHCNNQIR